MAYQKGSICRQNGASLPKYRTTELKHGTVRLIHRTERLCSRSEKQNHRLCTGIGHGMNVGKSHVAVREKITHERNLGVQDMGALVSLTLVVGFKPSSVVSALGEGGVGSNPIAPTNSVIYVPSY